MMLGSPDKLKDWKGEILEAVRWHLSRREFIKAAAAGAAALAGGGLHFRSPAGIAEAATPAEGQERQKHG